MNPIHTAILVALGSHHAQRPMPFTELAAKLPSSQKALHIRLDEMFYATPALINRATVTKKGHTQLVVWPAGANGTQGFNFSITKQTASTGSATAPVAKARPVRPLGTLSLAVLKQVAAAPDLTGRDLAAWMEKRRDCASNAAAFGLIASLVNRGYLLRQGTTGKYTYRVTDKK